MEQQAADVSGRPIAVGDASASRMRPIHLSLVRAGRPHPAARPVVLETFRYVDLLLGLVATLAVHAAALPASASGAALLATTFTMGELCVIVAGAALWPVAFGLLGLYEAGRVRTNTDEAIGVLVASALALVACAVVLPLLLPGDPPLTRVRLVATLWPVCAAFALVGRWLCRRVGGARPVRRILIVGSGPRAVRLARRIEDDVDSHCSIVGFVDDPHDAVTEDARRRVLGPLSQLAKIVVTEAADEVFVALPFRSLHAETGRIVSLCALMGVPCRYLVDIPDAKRGAATEVASMRLEPREPRPWSVAKRAADVLGASVGLVGLAPLFAAIAIAIRVTSRGPVLFRQERWGLGRRPFLMYKFRTMRADAEALQPQLESSNDASGAIFKMRDDPRVTPIGRFLRRWSLDELPQLVNVLFGDMTLVGPRPMTGRDVSRLDQPEALRRFTVTPGLTGLWQVTSRDSYDFADWVEHDLDYIDGWSPALELSILARTFPTVLRGVGSV
jgi:exopolysaccharide biosynthesis polyprenyl glycosylphosphotransferase